jgi:hypothetical protein
MSKSIVNNQSLLGSLDLLADLYRNKKGPPGEWAPAELDF